MNRNKSQSGFTLIEMMLYVAILALMLLMISVLLASMLGARVKNQTIAEVDQQGMQVIQLMTQEIRNAESISLPTVGSSDDQLELYRLGDSVNPVSFEVTNNSLSMTETGGDIIPLTNDRVVVTDITFENLSYPDTPDNIRIEFTISHNNPENRYEYDYEKTFTTSATLRPQGN